MSEENKGDGGKMDVEKEEQEEEEEEESVFVLRSWDGTSIICKSAVFKTLDGKCWNC